jgi:hypothetical protein
MLGGQQERERERKREERRLKDSWYAFSGHLASVDFHLVYFFMGCTIGWATCDVPQL